MAASAGMSRRNPYEMAVSTASTLASEANSSEKTVERQKIAIVMRASEKVSPPTGIGGD